jgi:hypothetical protein
MELTAHLEAQLRELSASESIEVRENGARVATFRVLSPGNFAARLQNRFYVFGRSSTTSRAGY